MAGERLEGGERALQRAALDPFRPPMGEKGAQIARRAIGEIADAGRRAETLLEKREKLPGVAAVSLDRARGQAALVGEMLKPGADRRREVGRGGENAEFGGGGGLWHMTSIGAEGIKRRLPGRRHWRYGRRRPMLDRSNRLVKTMVDVLRISSFSRLRPNGRSFWTKWSAAAPSVSPGTARRSPGWCLRRTVRAAEVAEAIERTQGSEGEHLAKRRLMKFWRAATRGTNIELRDRCIDSGRWSRLRREIRSTRRNGVRRRLRASRRSLQVSSSMRCATRFSSTSGETASREAMSADFLRDLDLLPIRLEPAGDDDEPHGARPQAEAYRL